MKMQLVSIYDVKMREYNGLYLVRTLEAAVRMFGDTIAAPESQIGAHPEDFSLRKVGDFDTDEGMVVGCTPSIVMEAAEILRRKPDLLDSTPAEQGVMDLVRESSNVSFLNPNRKVASDG